MPFSIESTHRVHEGWATYLVATLRTPDGERIRREIEDHGEAVTVLPYDPDRRVAVVIRQFRAPPFYAAGEDLMLEAPAGILEEDDPGDCARREAMEEIGLRLGELESVGRVWTMPGLSTERSHLFLAPYGAADRVAAGGGLPEEHESIEVKEMALGELARMADEGAIPDLKLLLLVQTLRIRRPGLF